VSVPAIVSLDRPFNAEHVSVMGKGGVLSRKDLRTVIERLGGTCAFTLTPHTTMIVTTGDSLPAEWPDRVRRVMTEDELCRAAGLPDLETLRAQYYSSRDLQGMYQGLRDDHLRYLEKWGLIRSVAGRYSFADLHVVKAAAAELARGVSLNAILRAMMAERTGQLAFDFQPPRTDSPKARVVALPEKRRTAADIKAERSPERVQEIQNANYALAAKYFLEGAELDDGDERNLDGAAASYRRALLFDPMLVPALVNLANIHYERDELVEADAIYEKSIRIDPECFEAYFNLGNIHHDLARYNEAVVAYREALAINPMYPEAHFYLAVTLEKLGRSSEARPHWQQYRELDPEGEFVELAKEFSD
jgi:tetratricopeptide (TPR) repeat protein